MASGYLAADRKVLRQAFLARPDLYFRYFNNLLRGKTTLTGDLTPAYGTLPVEILSMVRNRFETLGTETRAVLILRDPVERCWSAIRMDLDRGRLQREPGETDDDVFLRHLADDGVQTRTDYPAILERLKTVFGKEKLYVGLFETMFQEAEIKRLSEFLGIQPRPELAARRVRVGSMSAGLGAETRAAAGEALRHVYAACATAMPETRSLWANMPSDLR